MGFCVDAELKRWGWYPVGGGELVCEIAARADSFDGATWPAPIEALVRGALRRIGGRAVAANLPSHIPQRMVDRACAFLVDLGAPVNIEQQLVTAACPGAGIFLVAEYEGLTASFSAYGRGARRRKPLPKRRSLLCATITLQAPLSSCIWPTSCCCRSHSRPA